MCIVFRPDSAKRFPEGCGHRLGAGTGRRKQDRGSGSLSGFRGMTGSRPAQRTVWTNPALWSATNQGNFFFSGQGPGDGAGILCGRRAARAHFRTAARARGVALESGEKKGRGEGRGRAVTVGGMVSVDRQGCRTGPWCKRLLSCLTCPEGTMPEEGAPAVCSPSASQSHVPGRRVSAYFQRFGIVPLFIERIALIKRAGRGREFEGGGTFSRWQKVPPPSRKQPFLLRAGGIRASGH